MNYKFFLHHPLLLFSICGIIIVALTMGCQTQRNQIQEWKESQLTPSYLPSNFTPNPVPSQIQRIAVLPLYNNDIPEDQLNAFDRILLSELNKTALFESILIDRTLLQKTFRQETFANYSLFPKNFFVDVQLKTNADAILFTEITSYQPHKPIRIGLKFTLIDIHTQQILWAFNEVFDTGLSTIHFSAQRYGACALRSSYPFNDKNAILLSPRLFLQYASYESFKTLTKD